MGYAGSSTKPSPSSLEGLLSQESPRASGFIVTIYGDVAGGRGGTLWMGSLIDCCTDHGLSENLVRTAVSRLVGAGRLVGERRGRKSFYRLTDAAKAEFGEAAKVLYMPPSAPSGWLIALGEVKGPKMREPDWIRLGQGLAIAPNRSDVKRPDALLMTAEIIEGEADLPSFAARHWPLGDVAAAYQSFIQTFKPIEAELEAGGCPRAPIALAVRLRLVHLYRYAALADPRLPRAAYPSAWPGGEARRLFVRVYLKLAETADHHIGDSFQDLDGPLATETAETRRRLDRLKQEAAR